MLPSHDSHLFKRQIEYRFEADYGDEVKKRDVSSYFEFQLLAYLETFFPTCSSQVGNISARRGCSCQKNSWEWLLTGQGSSAVFLPQYDPYDNRNVSYGLRGETRRWTLYTSHRCVFRSTHRCSLPIACFDTLMILMGACPPYGTACNVCWNHLARDHAHHRLLWSSTLTARYILLVSSFMLAVLFSSPQVDLMLSQGCYKPISFPSVLCLSASGSIWAGSSSFFIELSGR